MADRSPRTTDAGRRALLRVGLVALVASGRSALAARRVTTTLRRVRQPTAKSPTTEHPAAKSPTSSRPPATTRPAACALTPSTPIGESFRPLDLERRDITGGLAGTPLVVVLTLVDRACRPVAGTAVDLWHVDAMGGYSDPTEGHAEFRGTQRSDSGGTVEFVTIYPGWYAGRSVHLHVWVRAATPFATQVFFPDETNALVRARPPYSANTVAVTRNADDPYFVQLRGLTQATVVESTPALAARLQLVLPG